MQQNAGRLFSGTRRLQGDDLLQALKAFALVSQAQLDAVSKLRRSAEGRAVPLPDAQAERRRADVARHRGFARGEPGSPAIPYATEN
jgi:hypothetical protein